MEFTEIIRKVQNSTGYLFQTEELTEVVRYSKRKLEAIGKNSDYLKILFESELRDYVMRRKINLIGGNA